LDERCVMVDGGSELTEQAQVRLRVLRGTHRVFTYASVLGQLFPGGALSYRVPLPGRPTRGTYHVLGTISPQGSSTIHINKTITFTSALANRPSATGTPGWMLIALGVAAVLLIALPTAVWKLARRPTKHLAHPQNS
jgi:hypothetical protein